MKAKLISILIGLALVVGTGTLVYKTKKPVVLPSDEATESQSTINNTNGVQNQIPASNNTTTTSKNKSLFDDDDEDDDEDFKSSSNLNTTVVTPKPTTTTTTTTSSGITLTTIAKHNNRSSCWSAVNGNVYDLTSWIPNHPGGEQAILSMCGVDGSNGYNGQHSGGKPARILAGFKIGTLSK